LLQKQEAMRVEFIGANIERFHEK